MKGFIELNCFDHEENIAMKISTIVCFKHGWIVQDYNGIQVHTMVKESYEQIKQLIKEAQG